MGPPKPLGGCAALSGTAADGAHSAVIHEVSSRTFRTILVVSPRQLKTSKQTAGGRGNAVRECG
jgi:hypothetical protein